MHVFSAIQRNEDQYLDDRISSLVVFREKKEEDKTDLGSDKEAAENDLSFAATFKETENVNYSMFSFLAGRSEFA